MLKQRRPPSFPGLAEISLARRTVPVSRTPVSSLPVPALPLGLSLSLFFFFFLSPSSLQLTWFLSLYGPAPGGFQTFRLSTLHPFDSAVWSLAPPLPEDGEPSRTPSSPLRPPPRSPGRREEPILAPHVFPGSGLSDCPGLALRRRP